LKSKPDYADALAELGQYYLMQKEYSQAEKQIRRALEIDPDHYSANFYLLTLYTRTGDARQEAQSKRFDELKKLLAEKMQEFFLACFHLELFFTCCVFFGFQCWGP
jgi:tetratricopeptide (TPR) repeat protein